MVSDVVQQEPITCNDERKKKRIMNSIVSNEEPVCELSHIIEDKTFTFYVFFAWLDSDKHARMDIVRKIWPANATAASSAAAEYIK